MKLTARIFALFLALVLTLTLVLPAATTPAAAETTGGIGTQRYNIVLLIDASGSLLPSKRAGSKGNDPDGMRFELIDELLGILPNEGHNVNAILFTGNESDDDASDSAMATAVWHETGFMMLEDSAPGGLTVKDYINKSIRGWNANNSTKCQTDIGSALLVAERQLQEQQKKNGLPSLIFLFSDGKTDVKGKILDKSNQNKETALQEIRENDIRLFGAFLNKDGKLSSHEMENIVCDANGITDGTEDFISSYAEITSAEEIGAVANKFLRFLGYIVSDDSSVRYGSLEESFTIPGIGVEEINFLIYSPDGNSLPNDMRVELVKPDNSVLTNSDMNSMGRKSRTFRQYKLEKPTPGTWTLKITMPEGSKIGYVYSPILSLNIGSEMEISPDPANLTAGQTATFTGYLMQNGSRITTAAEYTGYECVLKVTDLLDANRTTTEYPIANTNAGKFEHAMQLTAGEYEAYMEIRCGDLINTKTAAIRFNPGNQAPTAKSPQDLTLPYGLFQSNVSDTDLTKYIDDREDGKNLTLAITNATVDAANFQLNGTTLHTENKKIGEGVIELSVTDSGGLSTQLVLNLKPTDVTVGLVIAIIAAIVAILIAILIIIWKRASIKPTGELTCSFEVDVNGRNKSISLYLGLPGVNVASNTSLMTLINTALNDDTVRLPSGVSAEDVQNALDVVSSDLSATSVSKALKVTEVRNSKGKKVNKTIAIIRVRSGKQDKLLLNNAISLDFRDMSFTVEYVIESSDDSDFDNDFDVPSPKQKASDDLMDDMF